MRAAAVKLSQELFNMIERPEYAMVTRLQEGTESQVQIHTSLMLICNPFLLIFFVCTNIFYMFYIYRFLSLNLLDGTK